MQQTRPDWQSDSERDRLPSATLPMKEDGVSKAHEWRLRIYLRDIAISLRVIAAAAALGADIDEDKRD